ncbi:DUF4373 domain-containing protein [Sporosarcina sp. ANT_H38]|uniref:Lin1244/Lin1753 domain-containing protein n=1 Tax=Sporosarcina sp. ANT_H38 TaxID=2597358 RepID=UPI0011F283C6|nr:Lin1244/Lin1753 domain-containing protein [Sporosarcina sp. ANT_H38]KAA0944107.1 DUF4373 domain-containing protein [Sporosarcina sp. ANT_H38]
MARPQKRGLDYFPLDVDIDQDDKIQLVEALHGMTGFSVVIKLLMRIYKEGYYYEWGEMEHLLFSRRVNVDINTLTKIVNDCIKYGIFNKGIYETYKVLTSAGIQERYFEATKRRKNVTVVNQYMLINDVKKVNVDINEVNVDINGDICNTPFTLTPQSKVKERKVNQSKQQETKEALSSEGKSPEQKTVVVVDKSFGELISFYEENVGLISPHVSQELGYFVDDYNSELVFCALKKSVEARPKNLIRYTQGILKNWANHNVKTVEDVLKLEELAKTSNVTSIYERGGSNETDRRSVSRDDAIKSRIDETNERRKRIAGIESNRDIDVPF